MSWHDLMNVEESEEDRALRAEMRELLGVGLGAPGADAAPDAMSMVFLARTLRQDALRRGRVSAGAARAAKGQPFFTRPLFVNLAAAALIVAAVGALGAWGSDLKRREEALAAKTIELEMRQSRMDEAKDAARDGEPAQEPSGEPGSGGAPVPRMLQASGQATPTKPGKQDGRGKGDKGELVKPEENPTRLDNSNEQYRVKDSR